MRRGEVNRRLNSEYYHPERMQAISQICEKWGKQNRAALGEVLNFGEAIRPYSAALPYIGLANVESEFGSYIATDEEEPEGTCRIFERGQVLYGKLRPYLNKVYITQESGQCSTEFYCLSAKDSAQLLPPFFAGFLMSQPFLAQTIHMMTGNTHPRIQLEDFKEILIPLLPLDIQQKLVSDLEAAREARKRMLAEADALLAGIDGFLLEQLRQEALEEDNRQFFAVRLKQVRNRRIDASSYRPYFKSGVQITTPLKSLSDIADIDSNPTTPPSNDETLVPYVGLPECDLNEVREVVMRPYKEVRGRSVVKPGDILFARIEPSVFNRKYVFVDDLKGHDQAYTSTEFYVVRGKEGVVEQGYLYAMFFCSFVFTQVKGKTTGSSGRRRIDPEMFAALQIPLPDMALQKTIAAEITRRRDEARRLRAEAAKEWEAAKVGFEQELLS